ncbi:FIST C-terminal domain-containing protein [Myxococcota bacterium]|nr:FIST C-terminal domain-containing protein [Myxococcota bacterium]MBU1897038.1 FIST C-terminal domain-containing protein [Myxococcota bacterium]
MTQALSARRAQTQARDEDAAVAALYAELHQPQISLALFFCSPRYNLARLGAALQARFDCPIVGCTTAGEISSEGGYQEGGIVGATLASPHLRARVGVLRPLDDDAAVARGAAALLDASSATAQAGAARFGLLLIDGLSMAEESVTAAVGNALGGVPLIGGSAGDDARFEGTFVYWEGAFHQGLATLCLVETTLPLRAFQTQHFQPTPRRFVVTEAEPERRRILELDGLPAADVYAEALGLSRQALNEAIFSEHPLLLRLGGRHWVRTIQRVEPNGALRFYCAIDSGLVLTLGRAGDMIENLKQTIEKVRSSQKEIGLVIGCDCIFRRVELNYRSRFKEANDLLKTWPFVGFSTYGEQYNSLHMNQTLTGIAIGANLQDKSSEFIL